MFMGDVQKGPPACAKPGPARPQDRWRAERTRQYVSKTTGRERRWRTFSTFPVSVIGRAGPFARHHRCSKGVFGGAASPEG